MKLRNKKTGEKYEAISHEPIDIYFYSPAGGDGLTKRSYDSIADLNEEWEDYKPAEPLIKDASMQQEIIDLNNRVAKLERQTAESQSHIPESSIGKWF